MEFCENPEELIGDSVTVAGYTPPAVEGTTVTFHCPPGAVLHGINSSTCMENGEWEPALFDISCTGTIVMVAILYGFLELAIINNILELLPIHDNCITVHGLLVYCYDINTGGSFSGLSDDGKIAVASSIAVFIMTSILCFTSGFLCRHFCHNMKSEKESVTQSENVLGTPYYDDVVLNQCEQQLESKENIAYDLDSVQ